MYKDLIITESENIQKNSDNDTYIVKLFEFLNKNKESLLNVKNEIDGILTKGTDSDTAAKIRNDTKAEFETNVALITPVYKMKHKKELNDDVKEVLLSYSYLVVFLRHVSYDPKKFKIEGIEGIKSQSQHIKKMLELDKENFLKLSKEFINQMENAVEQANNARVKESYYRLKNLLNSQIVTEDVKMEGIKDFLKDIYRLPFKVIAKPFGKICFSLAGKAAGVIKTILAPFVKVIEAIKNFIENTVPKALVNFLTKIGLIKSPLIGSLIESGFKMVIPFAISAPLFIFSMFNPRVAMIASAFSIAKGIADRVISINGAAEFVSGFSLAGNLLSSFSI